jgi:hypothetical protein
MEKASTKLSRAMFLFIVAILVIKNATSSGIFEARDHKGKGYYVVVPQGWKKVKKKKEIVYPEGVTVVMFVPKGTDTDLEVPDAYISIFTKKLTTPIWVEDEFPDILKSIHDSGFKIMDKGDIKLGGTESKWVVYHDKKAPALILEFYMVTDTNVFFKMQYSAHPDLFNKERAAFEELKDSFKFRFSLF